MPAQVQTQRRFAELYDDWFGRAHGLSYTTLHNADEARYVVQESFLTAWRRLDTLRDPDSFGSWLLQITLNEVLGRMRRSSRVGLYSDDRLERETSTSTEDDIRNAVDQRLFRIRNKPGDAIRARVVYRHGDPVCDDLSSPLSRNQVDRFNETCFQVVKRHIRDCDVCTEYSKTRLTPAASVAAGLRAWSPSRW